MMKKTKTGKKKFKGNLPKKKRAKKANKKTIEKMNRIAERLMARYEKDIKDIRKQLFIDEFKHLDEDASEGQQHY